MSKINEYVLRITGGACLGSKVDASLTLKIKDAEISIYSVEKRDNQDGTFNIVYKGKIMSAVTFDQGGKVIKGRDKTRQSVKVRYAVQYLADEAGAPDREEFYKIFTDKIISNPEEVWERIKDL